jgi:NAD(P)-dependent dehydrogenase (short-subunit alcohol dehydrogenase family)
MIRRSTQYFIFLACLSLTQNLWAEKRLRGKNIFVTGGSSGIGRALVEAFAAEGAKVAFTYNKNHGSVAFAEKIAKEHKTFVRAIPMDLQNTKSVRQAIAQLLREMPQVDTLVNNAAELINKSFMETSEEDLKQIFQTNIFSQHVLIQDFSKHLITKKIKGSILNIGSFRGEKPTPRLYAYSVSKTALNSMNTMIASELAEFGIRVNLIAPGGTLTPMSQSIYNTPEKVEERGKRVPLGRYGKPTDHVGAAVYLVSDEAAWVSGAVLTIDGGESTKN